MLSSIIMFIYVFVLFFVLTPGVLVTLPPKSSKMVVALFHALVFAIVWALTHKLVWRASRMEGMEQLDKKKQDHKHKGEKTHLVH
jgi:amino acid permease